MTNIDNINSSLKLEIITPDDSFAFKDVYMAVMPGSEGEFGVLQGHVPLISILDSGVISIYDKNMKITNKVLISTGFVEVTNNSVLILVEKASLSD